MTRAEWGSEPVRTVRSGRKDGKYEEERKKSKKRGKKRRKKGEKKREKFLTRYGYGSILYRNTVYMERQQWYRSIPRTKPSRFT